MNWTQSRLFAAAQTLFSGTLPMPAVPQIIEDPNSAIRNYQLARAMYDMNNLYVEVAEFLHESGVWGRAQREFACPAFRVVEFYAAKLIPGEDIRVSLPIEAGDNVDKLKELIHIIWKNSNFQQKKQVGARWLPMYGDLFTRVVGRPKGEFHPISGKPLPPKVHFEYIEPESTTEIDHEERGFITYLRLDTPVVRRDREGKRVSRTVTEVWDLAGNQFRKWEHDGNRGTPIKDLGRPLPGSGRIDDMFQIDFIPITHTMFRDVGDDRGVGAYIQDFTKIAELDGQVTKLHQMLFRHGGVVWALMSGTMGGANRPLPGPKVEGMQSGSDDDEFQTDDDQLVYLKGEPFWNLPTGATLEQMVPNINWDGALGVIKRMSHEIQQDLPEMRYSMIQDLGSDLSSWAVRQVLDDAAARLYEARSNFESGLVRTHEMCLTVGQRLGIEGFDFPEDAFETGQLNHWFTHRDVFPPNPLEEAQAEQARASTMILMNQAGLSRRYVLETYANVPPEKIAGIMAEWDNEQKAKMEIAAAAQFNGTQTQQGQQLPGPGAQTANQNEE